MTLRIKEFREEMGISQGELAKRISNVQRNVSNWENGISEPDCATIVKLADLFEISIDELFGRGNDELVKAENKPSSLYRRILRLNADQKTAIEALLAAFGNK